MKPRAKPVTTEIHEFDLAPGRVIGGKYVVESKLGGGWEGEVYKVQERRTGIYRAAKLFYPQRNVRDRAVRIYAKKLDELRRCALVIQYHHSETLRFRQIPITVLISELVEGVLLSALVESQPDRRLQEFEAMSLLHALTEGIEEIHAAGHYHGDLHAENVMVRRRGVQFDLKVVDFFHYGPSTAAHRRDDVFDLVQLFYDALGGRAHYAGLSREAKAICKGLRKDLLRVKFPTVGHLRRHLEEFTWAP